MKILYLSHSKLSASINPVYIKGLAKIGNEVKAHYIKKSFSGYLQALKIIIGNKHDLLIIGYDSPQLVTFCRLFTPKKIVYNALCSVYERLIVARGLHSRVSLHSFYYWFLDFLAVSSANLVMLETNSQIDYFIKLFKFPKRKFIRALTGADDDNFYYDPGVAKYPVFTVLFRGTLMPESGAEYVVRAAKILEKEGISFIMQSGGMGLERINNLIEELKPGNLELKSKFMMFDDMCQLMNRCHLSLGQLSNHPRVERTIPHKAYESLAVRLPYVTAANRGIMEILKDGETCLTCKPADLDSLVEKILWAKNNYQEVERIADRGHKFYKDQLTSLRLAEELLVRI